MDFQCLACILIAAKFANCLNGLPVFGKRRVRGSVAHRVDIEHRERENGYMGEIKVFGFVDKTVIFLGTLSHFFGNL